ncbi:sigma 54-interacting transcriptional regulator [bacterium]|nr:sigma 54-interacting transcriptional regulator [bacterium]
MYLLIYRGSKHLFSFYINSARKKIVIGGSEGDILFPDEMRECELSMRKEFNFEKKDYSWSLYPVSGEFKLNGRKISGGEIFEGSDVFSLNDFSFSFSPTSNLVPSMSDEPFSKAGNTLVIEDEPTEFKNIETTFGGIHKTFVFRPGRRIVIGRKNADISVAFDEVSSEHVILEMSERGILFLNKGKNGTWVNGVRINNGILEEGKYRFSIAGRHDVTIKINKEKTSETFLSGSLSPYFEQIENWLNQPVLFRNHPIILLSGESGSGKEVFAEFIHKTSGRKGAFITYNAASIPETLAESELFGTAKGGFTGAEERDGAFMLADGGTLFLDEIAEIPVTLQSKLLRVLEDWNVRKVGESGIGRKVDVNLVLATNKDLENAVTAQTFRKDLFYRISTLHVKIPPLRDHEADIVPLAKHLYRALSGRELEIEDSAVKKLLSYSWPGNIRELKSVITRFAYSGKSVLGSGDLQF